MNFFYLFSILIYAHLERNTDSSIIQHVFFYYLEGFNFVSISHFDAQFQRITHKYTHTHMYIYVIYICYIYIFNVSGVVIILNSSMLNVWNKIWINTIFKCPCSYFTINVCLHHVTKIVHNYWLEYLLKKNPKTHKYITIPASRWVTRWGGRMSRASISPVRRSGNPNLAGSNPDPVGSNPGRVKITILKFILVTS